MCSTPVGVKDRFTISGSSPQFARSMVLNACRRQRSVHVPGRRHHFAMPRCSTPVGVKDRFTGMSASTWPEATSAQRLSASKIGSPRCTASRRRRAGVLNACRRQRSVHRSQCFSTLLTSECSTPVGVKDRFTATLSVALVVVVGAQRLSASKIGSQLLSDGSCAARNCAQRLSASKIGSPSHTFGNDAQPLVLNACRRQRSVHTCTARPRQPGARLVLNACRRQRSVHTQGSDAAASPEDVLNACRRQRSVHTRCF